LAALRALSGAREDQPLPRARHAHVAEPPFLFEIEGAVRTRPGPDVVEAPPGMREKTLLHPAEEDAAPFQALGAVERHQGDCVAGVTVCFPGIEREPGEIAGKPARERLAVLLLPRVLRGALFFALLVLDQLPQQRLHRFHLPRLRGQALR